MSTSLILATHNQGKVKEIAELLADFPFKISSAGEHSLQEPEENGVTFIENAKIKAEYVASQTGYAALADDSGLCVACLQGQPGIYSARWGGKNKDFTQAMHLVHEKMQQALGQDNIMQADEKARAASMHCALVLAVPKQDKIDFYEVEGIVEGCMVWPMRGEHGFGYDAMFMPHGHQQSFAQMPPALKQSLSHRHHAFERLRPLIKSLQ